MKTGEYRMQRFEPFIGQWRVVATNILLFVGIDLVDLELPLKIFVLIVTAIISIFTLMIKYRQWKKLK